MAAPVATRDSAFCVAVAAHTREALRRAPVPPAYRDALAVALAMPGNVLSAAPDARWARLVWTCCAAAGGDPQQVLPLATVVEVFMVALDLLDDAEDAEETPVLAALGAARALNVSTGLLLLALRDILGADGEVAAALLLDAALQACGGQDADLTTGAGRCGAVDEALDITTTKTVPLAAVACRLGALAAGADETTQNLYGRFGRYLGVAAHESRQDRCDAGASDPTARLRGPPGARRRHHRRRYRPLRCPLGRWPRPPDLGRGRDLSRLRARPDSPLDRDARWPRCARGVAASVVTA